MSDRVAVGPEALAFDDHGPGREADDQDPPRVPQARPGVEVVGDRLFGPLPEVQNEIVSPSIRGTDLPRPRARFDRRSGEGIIPVAVKPRRSFVG